MLLYLNYDQSGNFIKYINNCITILMEVRDNFVCTIKFYDTYIQYCGNDLWQLRSKG